MPKAKVKNYKMKTHKAAAKRFSMTASGKLMRTKGGKSHLRRRTSKRTKGLFGRTIEVMAVGDRRRLRRVAPYMRKYRRSNPPG